MKRALVTIGFICAPVMGEEPVLPPECDVQWTYEYIRSFPQDQWQELRRTRAECQNIRGQIADARRPKLRHPEYLQVDAEGVYSVEASLVNGTDPDAWVTEYAGVVVTHTKYIREFDYPSVTMRVHPRTLGEMVVDERVKKIVPLGMPNTLTRVGDPNALRNASPE